MPNRRKRKQPKYETREEIEAKMRKIHNKKYHSPNDDDEDRKILEEHLQSVVTSELERQKEERTKYVYAPGDICMMRRGKYFWWPCFVKRVFREKRVDKLSLVYVNKRKEDISNNLPFKYRARDKKVKKFQWRNSSEFKQLLQEHANENEDFSAGEYHDILRNCEGYLRARSKGDLENQEEQFKYLNDFGYDYNVKKFEKEFKLIMDQKKEKNNQTIASSVDGEVTVSETSSDDNTTRETPKTTTLVEEQSEYQKMREKRQVEARKELASYIENCKPLVDFVVQGKSSKLLYDIYLGKTESKRYQYYLGGKVNTRMARWKPGDQPAMFLEDTEHMLDVTRFCREVWYRLEERHNADFITNPNRRFYYPDCLPKAPRGVKVVERKDPDANKVYRFRPNAEQNDKESEVALHVFYPEAVIFALMKVRKLTRTKAEKVFSAGYTGIHPSTPAKKSTTPPSSDEEEVECGSDVEL